MRTLWLLLPAILACSSDDSNAVPDSGNDTSTVDAAPDAAPPSYPAFTVDAPQVAAQGGPVLAAPIVQPVYFPGFDYATQITSMTGKLGASAYWKVLTEYKVGPITGQTPVALTSSQIVPADIGNISDAYIQSWLQSRFDGTHPEFGAAPKPNTVYALFYPTATVISLGGGGGGGDAGVPDGGGGGFGQTSCKSFGGYHSEVNIGTAGAVPYAVLPECPTFGAYIGVDASTATLSHELAEAATDPFPMSNPAYSRVDDNHIAWQSFLGGGEVGDMCAQFPTSFYSPSDLGVLVQRIWSNASAKAGTDPCQPGDGTAYFNTMPVFADSISARGITTKGVNVPVGQSKALELDLYSDQATSGPWALTAQAFARGGTSVPITFAFDVTSGQNGDRANLTVTSTGALTNTSKTATLVVTSSLGGRQNVWIGYVAQQ